MPNETQTQFDSEKLGPSERDVPFALPTHFEWYMVRDDSPRHPMTFTFVWTMQGTCDLSRWAEALKSTFALHPMAQCVLRKFNRKKEWVWEKTDSIPSIQEFNCNEPQFENTIRDWQRLDLSQNCGVKLGVVRGGEGWKLLIAFHHAVTDGIGAFEFTSDLFDAYCQIYQTSHPTSTVAKRLAKPPESEFLVSRGDLDRSIPHPVSQWTATKFFTLELLKFLTRPALNLAVLSNKVDSNERVQSEGCPVLTGLGLTPVEFDEDTSNKLRRFAQSNDCSLNEVLIALSMSAIARCKREKLGNRSCWITAILPINMRKVTKYRRPCHNGIGYAIMRRRSEQCTDVLANSLSVNAELKAVQEWSLAGLFLDTLGRIRRFPEWLQTSILKRSRPGTFVLSYIGATVRRFPTRRIVTANGMDLGDCQIHDFASCSPTRAGTELAILGSIFQDKLVLWLRHSEAGISAKTVRFIANALRAEIESLVATSPLMEDAIVD